MSDVKYEGTSLLTEEGEPLFGRQRNIRLNQQKISTTHLLLFILIFIGNQGYKTFWIIYLGNDEIVCLIELLLVRYEILNPEKVSLILYIEVKRGGVSTNYQANFRLADLDTDTISPDDRQLLLQAGS